MSNNKNSDQSSPLMSRTSPNFNKNKDDLIYAEEVEVFGFNDNESA